MLFFLSKGKLNTMFFSGKPHVRIINSPLPPLSWDLENVRQITSRQIKMRDIFTPASTTVISLLDYITRRFYGDDLYFPSISPSWHPSPLPHDVALCFRIDFSQDLK